MTEPDIKDLISRSPISFVGRIEHIGAATMTAVPIDDRTGVALVEIVLHAPAMFQGLEGQRVTVEFAPDTDPPAIGTQLAIFAEIVAIGETLALAEVGRAPVEAVAPRVRAAIETGEAPFASINRELETEALRDHANRADAVVVGTVAGLEIGAAPGLSEHDPDWWRATIDVRDVVRGPHLESGPIAVLYPSSMDLQWAQVPKPQAAEDAVWILHRTEGPRADFAPYQLRHKEDRQPITALQVIERQG